MKFKRYWILSSVVFMVLLINSKASLADPWERLGDIPSGPMGEFRVTLMNGKVYVTGGGGGTPFQVYDPSTDTWTRKANQLTSHVRYGACAVDGILYLIGGTNSPTGAMEAYDPATDTWTRKANMINPRGEFDVGVVDGIIYAIGGRVMIENIMVSATSTEAYDPGTDTWTRKANMINPRRMPAVSVIDGRIYVAGGGGGLAVYVEMYDPGTDTWTPLVGSTGPIQQDVILTNWAVSATVLLDEKSGDEKMYIMGGWPYQNRIWVYNPVSNTLELLDILMSAPKGWAAEFAFNNKMYITCSTNKLHGNTIFKNPKTAGEFNLACHLWKNKFKKTINHRIKMGKLHSR